MAIETGIERAIMIADFGEDVLYTPVGGVSKKLKLSLIRCMRR